LYHIFDKTYLSGQQGKRVYQYRKLLLCGSFWYNSKLV